MLTGQYMRIQFYQQADSARLGAQVISGVGFLGVDTILVTEKYGIKGLTTAAGLWTCACVGLVGGNGFARDNSTSGLNFHLEVTGVYIK